MSFSPPVAVRYELVREMDYEYGVDQWRVRSSPSLGATEIGYVTPGIAFNVAGHSPDGEWIQVQVPGTGTMGWCAKDFVTADGVRVEALRPVADDCSDAWSMMVDSPEGSPRGLSSNHSVQQDMSELLEELARQRRALESMDQFFASPEATCAQERTEVALRIQELHDQLALFGVPEEAVLRIEGSEALENRQAALDLLNELKREASFSHSEFENPRAESCWLSSLFQCLWHSRVFHAFFDRLVAPLPQQESGTVLAALQVTWTAYSQASEACGAPKVSPQAMVSAWGKGYGDSAEALGRLQAEIDSPDQCHAVKALADLVCLAPVEVGGKSPPTHSTVLTRVEAFGAQGKPIIVADITLPQLNQWWTYKVVEGFAPTRDAAELTSGHSLVAMVCYQHKFRHYVAFCRRSRRAEADSWIFFNDLPALSQGAYREYESWVDVAEACSRFGLSPKMLFYENVQAAEQLVRAACSDQSASQAGRCAVM